MSYKYDYWEDLSGICEMCGFTKCPTHKKHYDECGQEAIDVKEKCVHIQKVKEILRNVTSYEVVE